MAWALLLSHALAATPVWCGKLSVHFAGGESAHEVLGERLRRLGQDPRDFALFDLACNAADDGVTCRSLYLAARPIKFRGRPDLLEHLSHNVVDVRAPGLTPSPNDLDVLPAAPFARLRLAPSLRARLPLVLQFVAKNGSGWIGLLKPDDCEGALK